MDQTNASTSPIASFDPCRGVKEMKRVCGLGFALVGRILAGAGILVDYA